MKCKNCGRDIHPQSKVCNFCGCPVYPQSPKKGLSTGAIVAIVLGSIAAAFILLTGSFCIGCIMCMSPGVNSADYSVSDTGNKTATETATEATTEASTNKKVSSKSEYQKKYSGEVDDAFPIDKEVLCENVDALEGKKVLTAFKIADIDYDALKGNIDNGAELLFDIVVNFENEDEISFYKKDDVVAVVGVAEKGIFGGATLKKSHVVLSDKAAEDKLKELDNGSETQINELEDLRKAIEASNAEVAKENADQYKNECVSIDYSDVERNPHSYEGKKIVVSGTVSQVIEGWFEYTTLIVTDTNGNNWYITYWRDREESRILENDNITAYGECDGVSSYTSILGNQVTIPSMTAEYID